MIKLYCSDKSFTYFVFSRFSYHHPHHIWTLRLRFCLFVKNSNFKIQKSFENKYTYEQSTLSVFHSFIHLQDNKNRWIKTFSFTIISFPDFFFFFSSSTFLCFMLNWISFIRICWNNATLRIFSFFSFEAF